MSGNGFVITLDCVVGCRRRFIPAHLHPWAISLLGALINFHDARLKLEKKKKESMERGETFERPFRRNPRKIERDKWNKAEAKQTKELRVEAVPFSRKVRPWPPETTEHSALMTCTKSDKF